MKGIICFIAACAVYILGGLLVWSIVASFIDVPSSTIADLATYRIHCYSGVAGLVSLITLSKANVDDKSTNILLGAIFACWAIGILVNVWEISGIISTILTIVYNIVNVGVVTLAFIAVSTD